LIEGVRWRSASPRWPRSGRGCPGACPGTRLHRHPELGPHPGEGLGTVALPLHRPVAADLGVVAGPAEEREDVLGGRVDVGGGGGGEVVGHGRRSTAPRYGREPMIRSVARPWSTGG